MNGDLHCHTKLSDGTLGLEELINLAKKRGVEVIAITDRDCLAGIVRARVIGDRLGVKVIPGVEISALDPDTGEQVDVLAYMFDSPDRIEGLCYNNSMARKKASHFMMLKASQRYPISEELVKRCASGSTNLFEQHIMHALMQCGCTQEIYGKTYEALFTPGKASGIFIQAKFAGVYDVLDAIAEAGGISVLAHPATYKNPDLIETMIGRGLCGLEVWYPESTEDDVDRLTALAKTHKLLMVGGSDFKGMYNRGKWTVGDYGTPKQQLSELLNYKTRIKRKQKKAAQEDAEASPQAEKS